MNKLNLKGVPTATWVRIIGLLVILVNQVSVSIFNFQLVAFGDEEIYEGVSTLLTIVMAVFTGWKNNSLTKPAQEADQLLQDKKGDK